MHRHLPRQSFAVASLVATAVFTTALASSVLSDDPPAPAAPPTGPTLPPPSKAELDRASLLIHMLKPGVGGFVGDPYPLDHCIVDGAKLCPSAVTLVLKDMPDVYQEGRQMKFCCAECAEKFNKEPRLYTPKLDEEIRSLQLPTYPFNHCLVMIEQKLDASADEFVFGNRLYKVHTAKCKNNFLKNTMSYVAVYDKELTIKQKRVYPLDTCVVTGAKLPEKPYDLVIGARLVRLADEAAAKKFYETPETYLATLDEAMKAKEAKPTAK